MIPLEYLTTLAYQFLCKCFCPTAQNIQSATNSMRCTLADIDKLVRTLRESGTDGEKLCEIEASANCCSKNVGKHPPTDGF